MSSDLGQTAAEPQAKVGATGLRWLVVPAAIGLILGGATAWNSLNQSLWIDELHTAWVSTGPWTEVAARSAVGNQTPIYFAWQWWLGRTFGHSEACLRATSMIAWLGSLALFAAIIGGLVRRTPHVGLWWLVCLVAVDRQQIFFATEARPYMLMSLVVLSGWVIMSYCLTAQKLNVRTIMAWQAWTAVCATALWLQPTAILFVVAQFALAMWRGRTRWSIQVPIAVAMLTLVGLVWPMRYVLEPAWQGRQAWAAFAADLRWTNVLRQFPLLILGVPGVVSALVAWRVGRRVSLEDLNNGRLKTFERSVPAGLTYSELWFCGWAGPLAMVIGATALGIAPLMHARYLFAATLPLALWTACMLSRLRSGRLVAAIVCGMIALQVVQQGSVQAWLGGRLAVVERGERWREALAHIDRFENDRTEGDGAVQIYCAANFIEGGRSEFLDGSQLRENYLALPLRTLYQVPKSAQIVSLLNDPRTWPEAISSPVGADSTRWLLLRASKAGLAKRLQLSGLRPIEQFDFGAVQLVRF